MKVSSMNTVGGTHPTVLSPLPEPAADVMRNYFKEWREGAEVLARREPEPEPLTVGPEEPPTLSPGEQVPESAD
jgi:hypothetical protein